MRGVGERRGDDEIGVVGDPGLVEGAAIAGDAEAARDVSLG